MSLPNKCIACGKSEESGALKRDNTWEIGFY